ncbi:hypothetical protein DV738_g4340, partial [Chaetothyriales sp. CBS 135597]
MRARSSAKVSEHQFSNHKALEMEAQRLASRCSAIQSFNKTLRQFIDGTHKDYFEPKDLQKSRLTITIQRLPFTTGELPKGVQQFLKPIPPGDIYKWLATYKPWEVQEDFFPPNIKDNFLPNSAQTEASFFWYLVKIYLSGSDDMNARPIIPFQTRWRMADIQDIQTLRVLCNASGINWHPGAFFSYHLETNNREYEDFTKPHIMATISDDAPLQKDAVSKNELTTIVALATKTASHSECNHTLIPITVFSGSGRNIRIVQGVFNVQNGKLDLRISEIVNFDKGLPHLSASRGCRGDFDTTNCATHVIDFCTSARHLATFSQFFTAAGGAPSDGGPSSSQITGIYAPVRARRLRGDATKEAARPPVKLPDWFAQNFTALGEGELSSEAETSIQYVNHSDDSWRAQVPGLPPTEPKTGQVDAASIESAIGLKRRRLRQDQPGYYLQAAQHLEVVLTANGLIVPSPKEYADEPASKVSHLLLLYAADDGELLLDDYVHNLAFELGCDLMTLDTQDIAQLIVASNQPPDLVAEARHLSYDALYRTDSLAASAGDSIFHDELGDDGDDDYSDPFQSMPASNNSRLPVVIGKPITIDISDIFGTKAQRTHSFASRKPFRDAFVLPDDAKARSSDVALQNVVDRLLSALSEAKDSGPRPSRTMIYIKDLSAIQDSNTNIGHRFLAELYQQVERRRKNGEHIIIVGSESSKLDDEDISSPRWIERLQAPEKNELYRTITLTPILDQSAAAARLRLDRKLRIATINFRHIGEMMRLRSNHDTAPNLGPGFWKQDSWLGQSKQFWASTDLGKNILSFSEVHRIASVLSGLGQSPAHSRLSSESGDEGANLGLNLVQMLLSESDSSKTQWAKKQMSNKKLDQQAPSAEDEKLARVRASATKHEKKLLNGVIEPSKIRTTFNDVHVPVETIDALQTLTTLSLVRPDAFKYGVLASDRIPGLLLYGPPGTGKTLLAKAVAKQSGARVLEVSAADINDMYVGEGEKNVQALFSLAKKLSPCIVFLDEADAMFSARANSGRRVSHRELLNQFLKEWDGMSNDSGSAFIMVATNRPMDLDDAVLRRLPRRLLIDLPTEQDRLEILKIHLRHEKLAEDVQLDQLAKKTPFYSGSDLKNLAVAAALNAEQDGDQEYKYPETRTLTAKHFERALEEITASISEDMNSLKDIKKFDEQYGDRKGKKKRKPLWGFKTAKEADKVLDTVKSTKLIANEFEMANSCPIRNDFFLGPSNMDPLTRRECLVCPSPGGNTLDHGKKGISSLISLTEEQPLLKEQAHPALRDSGRAELFNHSQPDLNDDHWIALGSIRLLTEDMEEQAGWTMQGIHSTQPWPHPSLDHAEKRLWIRTQFLQYPHHHNQRAVLRIYVFPDDVGRAARGSLKEFRRLIRWLIPFIDTALSTWNGDIDDSVPIQNYAVPRSDQEESLFYIFNTLESPSPDVGTFKGSPYALRAMNDIIDDSIWGMKSTLYQYQKRSVAAMLQREERPAFSQDPRKPLYRDLRGKSFYLDIFEGAVSESPELYEEARGGILAETMGYGKTLICLALIMATRGHYPGIPEAHVERQGAQLNSKAPSLLTLAARKIRHAGLPWKAEFDALRLQGEHYDACVEELQKYHREFLQPILNCTTVPRQASKRATERVLRLCPATLVIVPPNLLVQWQHEIAKHIEPGALDLLVLDSSTKTTPDWQELMKYDIVLISKTRFEQEFREGYLAQSRWEDGYICPFTQLRWLRVICDEGHAFARSASPTHSSMLLNKMSFERLWSISGTPSHALHGVEVSLPSIDEADSTTRSGQVSRALEQRRMPATAEQETKDVERLFLIVTHLFRIPPWGNVNVNGGHTALNWKKYLAPFDAAGNRRCAPGLRTLLQSLMVRHRLSDIHIDLQLPPLHNRTVYLKPSYYDKLTLNLFMMLLISNAVASERTDEDYMHHPRNRKALDKLISNLRAATFHWFSIAPDDVRATMRNTEEYLEKKIDTISDLDRELVMQTLQAGQRALDDPGYRGFTSTNELGVYIENFPSHAAPAWSLTGQAAEPLFTGTTLAGKAQKYVAKHKESEYVAEGMVGEGVPYKQALASTRILGFTSAKLTYLCSQLLSHAAASDDTKSIVFYSQDNTAFFISEALELLGIEFRIYSRTIPPSTRAQYVHAFNTDPAIQVLLMDVKQAAHGLHVAAASRVYFIGPVWDVSAEAQAIKRAHRIGQTRPVFVETLVLEDTIEARMWQRRKRLSDGMVG